MKLYWFLNFYFMKNINQNKINSKNNYRLKTNYEFKYTTCELSATVPPFGNILEMNSIYICYALLEIQLLIMMIN
jgi:hypothetical protein